MQEGRKVLACGLQFIRELKCRHDQVDPAQTTVQGVDGPAKRADETDQDARSHSFSAILIGSVEDPAWP